MCTLETRLLIEKKPSELFTFDTVYLMVFAGPDDAGSAESYSLKGLCGGRIGCSSAVDPTAPFPLFSDAEITPWWNMALSLDGWPNEKAPGLRGGGALAPGKRMTLVGFIACAVSRCAY